MKRLSFCFPWEVSSVNFASGPYALPGTTIELSQAAIGLLLWAYPCLTSATRASLNRDGLTFNGVVAAIWIGYVAYRFHDVHEGMAEQTAIHIENGFGFWLGLAAVLILIAGIIKIVRVAADQGAEQVVSEGYTLLGQGGGEARRKTKLQKAEIALGADPRAEERARKAVITYSEFFDEKYLPHAKAHKRSWDRDVQLFRRIRDVFGGNRLNEITRHQIQDFHSSVKVEGLSPASADHHLKLIRHSLNLAVEWEMLDKNPALGIKQFNEDNKVEHYLDDDELDRLVSVLRANDPPMVCQVALFLLSTGARLSEALNADWAHIDRRSGVWRIPATNSKSKRVRSIPLNSSAIEVLDQLGTEGKSDHLFINLQTKERLTAVNKVWGRLRVKAGLPHLRLHDLRHQFASFLVNAGHTIYEVQKILGHSDTKVTERYAHLSLRTLERASNSASDALMGAGRCVVVGEMLEAA